MTAATVVSIHFSLLQIICAGVAFAFLTFLIASTGMLVLALVREHVKTWSKPRPIAPLLRRRFPVIREYRKEEEAR